MLKRLPPQDAAHRPNFSEGHEPSPKQFLLEKAPQTDVERIACLAYYLTRLEAFLTSRRLNLQS